MKKLTEAEKKQIREAVEQAELQTSGEIATAVINQSYDYAIYELLAGVLAGLIYSIIIFASAQRINEWLESIFWGYSVYHLAGFMIFSTFGVILLVYFLANIPFIDRLLVPRRIQRSWVKRRAGAHFFESGVARTAEGTGILIFISLLEHRVELLADSGIAQKVEPSQWQSIVDKVIMGIKKGELASYLSEAVQDCGELLAKEFPRKEDDVNELSDGIVELDS